MAEITVTSTTVAAGAAGPEEWFTGSVSFDDLSSGEIEGAQVAYVVFTNGARTNWHTHGTGQVLHVVKGRGFVATRERTQRLEPGDIAQIPAGTDHCHGAVEGQDFAHLAVSLGGTNWSDPPDRPEPVRD